MDKKGLHLQRYVCRTCRTTPPYGAIRSPRASQRSGLHIAAQETGIPARKRSHALALGAIREQKRYESKASADQEAHNKTINLGEVDLDRLSTSIERVLQGQRVPSEQQSAAVIESLENAARKLVDTHGLATPSVPDEDSSATSAILSLDSRTSQRKPPRAAAAPPHVNEAIDALSLLAYRYVVNPRTFITTDVLTSYVKIQALLSRPDSFPEIFDLFANKPIPIAAKTAEAPPRFEKPKAEAINSSIPPSAASLALSSALHVRKLPLALSIIITSYQRPAFRKAKAVRRALPPITVASLTPVAFWTLASNMAYVQTGLPPETFTQMAFAGFATYAGAVGTIGYVAMTSANDQMKRVTWVPGMPLWTRWVREEERAAVDRVVCTWGFKEQRRWGDEEGEDWEELKEWAGRNGMIVDRVALMEGMQ